jgi:putative copper export protein
VLSPDLLLATTWGRLWLLRLATTAVAALALWRVTRDQPGTGAGALAGPGSRPRSVLAVAAVALVGSAGLDSWAGHAATLPARTTVTILAATLHVLAAGVWAGGLVVVLTGIRPVLRLDPRTRRTVPSAAWRAYSPMAAVAAGVLAATGVYEAARHVEGVSTVLSSTYGVAVVVKVLLLAGALVLAGHATLVVNPGIAERVLGSRVAWRPQPRRLARTVAVEAVVLVAAVAVAALMTSVPTARQVTRAAEVSAPAHSTVDGLFVTVESVSTGTSQRLVVRTEPVVRPLLAPVTGVEVGDAGRPGVRPVALSEADPGRYEGMWTDPIEGGWQARVALHREGRPDSVLLVPLTARAGDVTTALELAGSGLAVLLLAGIAWVVVAAARRRGTPRPETVGRPDAGATPRAADLRAGVS